MTREEELLLFCEADWDELSKSLLSYAEKVVFDKQWRTPDLALPKGFEAPDLVSTVISKTFEWINTGKEGKGARKWNRVEHPDLVSHLRSAIDSEASNLVRLAEHKSTNYSADVSSEDAKRILENQIDESTGAVFSDANDSLEQSNELIEVMAQLFVQFEKDEHALIVLLSYQEQAEKSAVVKQKHVAESSGLAISDVRNAVKRIRRVALDIRATLREQRGESNER